MKKYDKESVIEQFEKSGSIMYRATLDGDYKANNREGNKLTSIFKVFEKDNNLADECLSRLIQSKNVVVRTEAAAYYLALRKNVDIAEKTLEEIMNCEENGIFGFNAKMILKVWWDKGELLIYQK